jgi:hypothetical protein
MTTLGKIMIPALVMVALVTGCSASDWIAANLGTDTLSSFITTITDSISNSLSSAS